MDYGKSKVIRYLDSDLLENRKFDTEKIKEGIVLFYENAAG